MNDGRFSKLSAEQQPLRPVYPVLRVQTTKETFDQDRNGPADPQVAHASLEAYEQAGPDARREWKDGGQKKLVLKVKKRA